MKIIGISGKAGHGKNTFVHVARIFLDDDKASKVVTVAMGDTLKDEVKEVVTSGLVYDNLFQAMAREDVTMPVLHDVKTKTEAGRRFLQWYGTEYRRAQDPDYWVKRAVEKIEELGRKKEPPVLCLIPDIRFPNEADYVKKVGKLIRIKRLNDDLTPYVCPKLTEAQHQHISETGLDNYVGFNYIVKARDMVYYPDFVQEVCFILYKEGLLAKFPSRENVRSPL